MRTYTPIHEDPNLNDDWWAAKGLKLGEDIYYNAIRDGSGRFDGYVTVIKREVYVMRTLAHAEEVILLMEEDE